MRKLQGYRAAAANNTLQGASPSAPRRYDARAACQVPARIYIPVHVEHCVGHSLYAGIAQELGSNQEFRNGIVTAVASRICRRRLSSMSANPRSPRTCPRAIGS